ncbi:MAG: hypothetical protein INR65_18880, partial [Gluconacetobacter diazotrophicus]|nr:hypothetical protein [Gluconacetobacter diazotrophicus]
LHATPRTSTWPFLQCAYPVGNSFLATEGAPTSAGNLEWFCRVMLDAEAERAAARGKTIYEVCEHLVGDALSRRSDILFFPFLFGGGPRNAPAGIVGLTASGSLSDVVGAIYEGIAFAHRLDIDRLLSGPDAAAPVRVRLAGGGARSLAWPQLFSDVLRLPVEVMSCGELGAQGSALCAAAAIGASPDLGEAVRTIPRVSRSYAPDPDRAAYYDRKFARFRRAVDCLGETWTTEPVPVPSRSPAEPELAHA